MLNYDNNEQSKSDISDQVILRCFKTETVNKFPLTKLRHVDNAVGGIIHVCPVDDCKKNWHFVSFTRDGEGQLTIYDTADGSKATGEEDIQNKFSKYIIVHLYVVYVKGESDER